jgi:DNA-binding MarR family transcriptional regulator
MDRTTLTAALKPLERDGLVAIARDPGDRRNRLLRLTDKGRETLATAIPIWRDLHGAIEAGVAGLEPDNLRGALNSLSKPASSRASRV